MLKPIYLNSFEKETNRDKKRGKDLSKLRKIINKLLEEELLPPKNRNHKLKGEFEGYWECHIEPDWLLIYKVEGNDICFVRTGSHSEFISVIDVAGRQAHGCVSAHKDERINA